MDAYERFWSKVDKRDDDSCWEWTAGKIHHGYGSFWFFGRNHLSHRLAYILEVGGVPVDMFVCHHCDNPSCCNPSHLFLGTPAENARDKETKDRGNHSSGTNHYRAVFTPSIIQELREAHRSGVSYSELGRRHGANRNAISRAINGRTYRGV